MFGLKKLYRRISIAVTKCEEICLAVKKGARRSWRVLCKLEKEEVTGGLGGEGGGAGR